MIRKRAYQSVDLPLVIAVASLGEINKQEAQKRYYTWLCYLYPTYDKYQDAGPGTKLIVTMAPIEETDTLGVSHVLEPHEIELCNIASQREFQDHADSFTFSQLETQVLELYDQLHERQLEKALLTQGSKANTDQAEMVANGLLH